MKRMFTFGIAAVAALLSASMTGCGGGSSSSPVAGIGGTGKVSSGSITAFGSIFVNGVEYDISNATITIDEDSAAKSQEDLSIGMVVTINGTADASTGIATSVVFDSNAKGPVSGLTTATDGLSKTFNIFGLTVRIDQTTVFDNSDPGFTFSSIADNDVVRVSGFLDNGIDGTLRATYIERIGSFDSNNPGNTSAKIKGTVSGAPVGGAIPVNGDSFVVNGITVTLTSTTTLDDSLGGLVTNDSFVEVQGTLTSQTTMDATRVERESTTIGDSGVEVELEGLVAGFATGGAGNFLVGGQTVNALNAQLEPPTLQLADGLRVEIEGSIDSNGVLIAEKIEAGGNESIEIEAPVSAITPNGSGNNGTITLDLGSGSITVITDDQTAFEDSTGADTPPLMMSELSAMDFVEIKGYLNPAGQVVAVEVRRDAPDDIALQGPVDSFNAGNDITVLGVRFQMSAGTRYQDINDNSIPGTTFFNALQAGDIVQIKDATPGDRVADEVEQES